MHVPNVFFTPLHKFVLKNRIYTYLWMEGVYFFTSNNETANLGFGSDTREEISKTVQTGSCARTC
jgi:hypothetical protein